MTPDMYVRIDALGKVGLPAETVIRAVATALTELGAAQALALIHGPERGLARYWEAGGVVRFTSWGDPYIPVDSRRGRLAGRRSWYVREDVIDARMRSGRDSVPPTIFRGRWWVLTLRCGHVVERAVQYRPASGGNPDRALRLEQDAKPAPKCVRCDECTAAVIKSGARARREFELA